VPFFDFSDVFAGMCLGRMGGLEDL